MRSPRPGARDGRLLVVNTSRGDALVDERYADDEQLGDLRRRLEERGVDHEVVHSSGAARRTRRSLRSPRSAAPTLS